jgi:hypothetical protein
LLDLFADERRKAWDSDREHDAPSAPERRGPRRGRTDRGVPTSAAEKPSRHPMTAPQR